MVILREQGRIEKEIENTALSELLQSASNCCTAELGIAVDIGTTTIAMTVLDICRKRILGQVSEVNCQTSLGADVMMRIMHARRGKAYELHQMVVSQIERMAEAVLKGIPAADRESGIEKICFSVVGNTTMCHLFLNQSVEKLAGYPFEPAYRGNYRCRGNEIGMEVFADAKVVVLSGIAAHVGSDALAVIGAEGLYDRNRLQLAVDLGTNAEIILNNHGRISVCSAAAGPAFEGKGIRFGMPAKAGAVTGVKLSSGNGNIILEYIPGEEIKGICGSGLIDLLAELYRCKLLQPDGYLLSKEEAVRKKLPAALCGSLVKREGEHAFLLYTNSRNGKEVYLLQKDIRGAQLAKGAIEAGILSLLENAGMTLAQIEEVYVAGVLGSCLNPANAIKIGLLPKVSAAMHFTGNAAGKGAACMLLRKDFCEKLEQLAGKIQHVELANSPGFQKGFLASMNFEIWRE